MLDSFDLNALDGRTLHMQSQTPSIMSNPESSSSSTVENEAAAFQKLYPRKYLSRFLAQGRRPDGRIPYSSTIDGASTGDSSSSQYRSVKINNSAISTANGSALVRWGDTTMVCGVKAEIAEPDWDRPNEGWIGKVVDTV